MGLEELFSGFGGAKKELVYLAVTPGVGLEFIQLDVSTRSVVKYAYRHLEYNEALREISNINLFKEAVSELFEELKIDPKCNVVLSLPTVFFGYKDLPLMLGDEAITEALTSEVEQSYVFKRHEPLVSWVDSNSSKSNEVRRLFYSAIQKDAVEQIRLALAELGATLVNVDVSVSGLMKALIFSGLVEEQTKENVSWNLMIINSSGYSICSMLGKNVIDYYEEPLAIKSFEGDEIYNAISASTQITLMSYPANYLYIVSETDIVSAELLAKKIHVDCAVDFCDNNAFKKQDFLPVSLEVLENIAQKVSLEAIGCAAGNAVSIPLKFNFLGKASGEIAEDPNEPVSIVIGTNEYNISPNMARNFALIFAVILLVPALMLMLLVPFFVKNKQAALDDVSDKLSAVETEIKKYQVEQNKNNVFDVNQEMKNVIKNNRAKLIAFTALGEAVPSSLWINYFVAKDDGKFNIKGEASNVEVVYVFFRNMKDSLINTKLRLHKLDMLSTSIDEAVSKGTNNTADYTFEITNMANVDAKPVEATNNEEMNKDKKPVNLLNKPLLNLGKEQ